MSIWGPKWQEGRIEAIERRLDKTEEQIRQLHRERRELLTEWESTFEKFNALWARLSKRLPKNGESRPRTPAGEHPQGFQPEPEPTINPLALRLKGGLW